MNEQHPLQEFLQNLSRMFFAAGTCAAVLILIGEAIFWLSLGTWPGLSFVNVLAAAGIEWATAPAAFLLLHQFLSAMPLAVMALFLGMAAAGLARPVSGPDVAEVESPPTPSNVVYLRPRQTVASQGDLKIRKGTERA